MNPGSIYKWENRGRLVLVVRCLVLDKRRYKNSAKCEIIYVLYDSMPEVKLNWIRPGGIQELSIGGADITLCAEPVDILKEML